MADAEDLEKSVACPYCNLPETDVVHRLYRTGDYSDLKIECGSKTYNVHKAVICPKSGFFARTCAVSHPAMQVIVCSSRMLIRSVQKSGQSHHTFPCHDRKLFELMIGWSYHLEYRLPPLILKLRVPTKRAREPSSEPSDEPATKKLKIIIERC